MALYEKINPLDRKASDPNQVKTACLFVFSLDTLYRQDFNSTFPFNR